ncbi:hypothetical protein FHT78_005423 [Rhizobium sp. BK196]|uniref:hypothetical protein n=1 Tax=Rhizobium sp. BK196 TaxID=2587073 RepID=UPI00160C6A81|nr:hypothetical protein [Rhizobium sp. BK196]MBB3313629.1 hypothetical protein [Rhizobium sp. BK196]
MTTVYVKTNSEGKISEVYWAPQPDMDLQALPEDDAEVQAFLHPTPKVESVSSRQFKLQLLKQGLLDKVNGWVALQARDVQIAYEYSGTFVKDSPMMQTGFAAMGFTPQQIDAFFEAAAQL